MCSSDLLASHALMTRFRFLHLYGVRALGTSNYLFVAGDHQTNRAFPSCGALNLENAPQTLGLGNLRLTAAVAVSASAGAQTWNAGGAMPAFPRQRHQQKNTFHTLHRSNLGTDTTNPT